jgi:hypothetical protein
MNRSTSPALNRCLALGLWLLSACFFRAPNQFCSEIDNNVDGEIDFFACADGCFLYDADGDQLFDDRVCEDLSGCFSLDIDNDNIIDQSDCEAPTGCSLTDADEDQLDDDTFCIKSQGCFVLDIDSDGVVEQDNCPSCISWEPAELSLNNDVVSDCTGQSFVSFHAGYQLFVGIILCDSSTYKILLSSSLEGTYFNVGDAAGGGQDHCELVNTNFSIPNEDDITSGGCATCDIGSATNTNQGEGFVRNSFGEGFFFELDWIPNYLTPGFYSCGIDLPSADQNCVPSPECKQLDRDGDGLADTFDCSVVNGCIASDFDQDSLIDSVVCNPGGAP